MYQVHRYHDICAGHRVVGHEGKCQHLHGHNYRIHFTCQTTGKLDDLGRVIDFNVVKEKLCMWVEENWDHKMLIWENDPLIHKLYQVDSSIVPVAFNPTAENMAAYLVKTVGPRQLEATSIILSEVTIEETRKCSATYRRDF